MSTPDEAARARDLSGKEKRTLALLGLPTFGLALAIGAVTTYVPLLAKQFTSSTSIIGLVIGAEGAVALIIPLAAGAWSDQLRTSIGGRLPFVLAGTPLLAVSIVLLGFMHSLLPIALLVLVFFIAYYVAYEPYRALYPDMLEQEVAGRGQSSQALFRGAATGCALIGGGLLFKLSPQLPFVVAGPVAAAALGAFIWRARRSPAVREQRDREARTVRQNAAELISLLRERPPLRAYLFANALWELSLAALKTFVMLFLTRGLKLSLDEGVAVIAGVMVLILVAAPVSGKLGDRFGVTRVVRTSLWLYGGGLLLPAFTQDPWLVLPFLPFIAFGGGMILSLPYAVLMPLMPEEEHGLITGFYSFSRGFGIMLGPLLAGGAISLLRQPFSSTQGYAAMWLVCGVSILASLAFMGPLVRQERRRRAEDEDSEGHGRARDSGGHRRARDSGGHGRAPDSGAPRRAPDQGSAADGDSAGGSGLRHQLSGRGPAAEREGRGRQKVS